MAQGHGARIRCRWISLKCRRSPSASIRSPAHSITPSAICACFPSAPRGDTGAVAVTGGDWTVSCNGGSTCALTNPVAGTWGDTGSSVFNGQNALTAPLQSSLTDLTAYRGLGLRTRWLRHQEPSTSRATRTWTTAPPPKPAAAQRCPPMSAQHRAMLRRERNGLLQVEPKAPTAVPNKAASLSGAHRKLNLLLPALNRREE